MIFNYNKYATFGKDEQFCVCDASQDGLFRSLESNAIPDTTCDKQCFFVSVADIRRLLQPVSLCEIAC